MTKQQYLDALANELRLRLSPDAAREVLEDYEGFFEEKRAEGLDDAHICLEMGDPAGIACEMARELGDSGFRLKAAISAALLVLYALFSHFSRFQIDPQGYGFATAALVTALAFLLRGERDRRGLYARASALAHLLLLGMMTAMVTGASAAVFSVTRAGGELWRLWNPILNAGGIVLPLGALAIAVLTIKRAGTDGFDCRPVVFHAVAAIAGVKLVCEALGRLDNPDTFWLSLAVPCALYAAMAGPSALMPLVVRRMRGIE